MAERTYIAELLRTLDQDFDPLHVDVTPSVVKLIALGLEGAVAVLDRLNAPEPLTRARAQRAAEGAVFRHFGHTWGQGFPDAEAERRAREVVAQIGYDPEAPEPQRLQAIERWRRWLENEQKGRRNE
jgi:hypothetical protein